MKQTKYWLSIPFAVLIIAAISAFSQVKPSEAKPKITESVKITLYKSPDCQCCSKWAAYMEEHGFSVTQKPTNELVAVKDQYQVPDNLRACHTAVIGDYVVEGHVPVKAVNKLLKEQPNAKGIAAPGMPAGAPGVSGPDNIPFQVFLFDKQGSSTVYGTY